jgi:hypothetical protein
MDSSAFHRISLTGVSKPFIGGRGLKFDDLFEVWFCLNPDLITQIGQDMKAVVSHGDVSGLKALMIQSIERAAVKQVSGEILIFFAQRLG